MTGRRVVWMRSAIVAVALAAVAVAIAGQCWLSQPHRTATHPNHPLASSVGQEFAINVDHGHMTDNPALPCPDQMAAAVLPQSATPAFEAAAVAAATNIAGGPTYLVVPAGRGPPGPDSAHTGQDLLTRFCLSRR